MREHPTFSDWTLYDGYYNKEVVKCSVWAKSFGRGNVYVQDEGSFDFTCSFGASSDYSYSGCFFKYDVKTIDEAKAILDEKVPFDLGHTKSKYGYNRRMEIKDWIKEVLKR